VAEGAELPDKGLVTQESRDNRKQVRLGGIGNYVAQEIERRVGKETRTVVLGHLQRGGRPPLSTACWPHNMAPMPCG
jgi:ATP-dependent phosphofructokinase / diphosphate-dependent phosphofructokinase